MAVTSFTVRQFFAIPYDNISGGSLEGGTPAGTFIVTGSAPINTKFSALLVNNNATNLSAYGPFTGSTVNPSGLSNYGWFAGPPTGVSQSGCIVAGNNTSIANTTPDGRTSYISCWGFTGANYSQGAYDTAFINLVNYITNEFGDPQNYTVVGDAKAWLESQGFYYQYPVGLDGQSPNTGTGS